MPHKFIPGCSPCNGHGTQTQKPELQDSPAMRGKKTMTRKEFKEWLKSIDSNGDGHISKDELHAALKDLGMSFTRWKCWRAMVHADLDGSNSIEGEAEIEELIKYARNRWGIIVT